MNKHDSERICGLLESLGASRVELLEDADVVVYMTCSVREKAEERLMGQVASMKNLPVRPGSRLGKRYVAVGGCIAQHEGANLFEQLDNVDVVFGTHNMQDLPVLLQEALESGLQSARIVDGRAEFHDDLPESREQAWAAWLPITVGCNNFCTYCIVPSVRGREISRPFEEIYDQACSYVQAGVREITLLGQNVNSYGKDLYGKPRFDEVLDAVSASGVERIRFATSHPVDLTDGVIDRFAKLDNLMPALHLPVQSGSNRILSAMNRRYSAEHYLTLVRKLRAIRPDIALSTDVIVGFPGETEEDFRATYDLIEHVGYAQVFTFIYSKRPGTPAASMNGAVERDVAQERFDRLVELVQDGAFAFSQRSVGTTVEVLVEGCSKRDGRMLAGKSPYNQTIHAPLPPATRIEDLQGRMVDVRVEEGRTWYARGSVVGGPR